MAENRGWIRIQQQTDPEHHCQFEVGGLWTVLTAGDLEQQLQSQKSQASHITLDLSAIESVDTTGVLLLRRWLKNFRDNNQQVELLHAGNQFTALDDLLQQYGETEKETKKYPLPLVTWLNHVGELTVSLCSNVTTYLNFIGKILTTLIANLLRPGRFRFTLTVNQLHTAGYNAIPIIALISFLIGIVVAYQGAIQLGKIGAKMLTVDLIAVSVLRELGVLLTAIVIAGRSASTFAAEIGSMKLQEEIKAMQTMGIDIYDVLVIPRMVAMIIILPILTFIADLMGLLGGAIMCLHSLDIPFEFYIKQLSNAVSPWTFWIGILKAPAFAAIIALVGCFEGLQVSGSAESLGRHTTRAVVISIFLIIVVDALFSVLFGLMGI